MSTAGSRVIALRERIFGLSLLVSAADYANRLIFANCVSQQSAHGGRYRR
jgi:hypothetical protein